MTETVSAISSNPPYRSIMVVAALWVLQHGALAADQPQWQRHAFPLQQAIWAVDTIDVNADGRRDLIAVGASRVWALLAPDSKPVVLADTPGGMTIHAVALDCDADGDLDLALGRPFSDWITHRQKIAADQPSQPPQGEDWTVAWVENPGRGGPPWDLHVLDRELHGVHGLWTGDVDRDGAVDLLADSFAGPHLESSLAWFRAPTPSADNDSTAASDANDASDASDASDANDANGPMPRRLITHGAATGRPHYMDFGDVNGDGRGDVLLGASTEGSFTWWEQPTDLQQPWPRHVIAWQEGATHPRGADLNGDSRLDVLGSTGHGQGIFWYQAPDWQKHVIDAEIRDVHAFDAADLDGDGDVDCAGCSFSQKIVRWWENLGDGTFLAHQVDASGDQEAYDLKIADMDGDGRPDILLAGRESENVVWYRNVATDSWAGESR